MFNSYNQVGTALRPAFTQSTPPDITAMACEVSISISVKASFDFSIYLSDFNVRKLLKIRDYLFHKEVRGRYLNGPTFYVANS